MLNRKFEACSFDLADKIIRQSHEIKQKKPTTFKSVMGFIRGSFIFNPAYAMPIAFAAGIILNIFLIPSANVNDFMESLYL